MATKDLGAKKSRSIRDNASMGRVVFLRPEAQVAPVHHSWLWFTHGRALAFLLVAIVVITSLAFKVSGTSFDYYPADCLGTWKNSENAEGQPTLKTNLANIKQFSERNSAVFFGGTQSIICQGFYGQSIPDEATLSSLNLTLSLAVKHPVEPTPTEESVEGGATEESLPEGASNESEFTIVDEPVVENGSPEEPIVEPAEENTPVDEPVGEVAPESEPEPVSEPEPSPEPEPAPSAPEEPSAFRFQFINRAHAQEQTDILATVLYSMNGEEWQALGHITQDSDWKNLLFRIPVGEGGVRAVADIPNLRIRVDAGFFSLDNPTEIYLDGMTVEINTDEYVSEEDLAKLAEIGEEPVQVGKVIQTFSLDRTVIPTEEVLSWQPLDYQVENEEDSKDVTRSVATVDPRTEDIIVSGSCKQDYFTVLVFSDPEAYATAPRAALFNSAYPCDNGLYSYRLTPRALHLKKGTYYLLVADQPQNGPWVPISAIMPFTIEEEVVN